jgi:hypothetical protein
MATPRKRNSFEIFTKEISSEKRPFKGESAFLYDVQFSGMQPVHVFNRIFFLVLDKFPC